MKEHFEKYGINVTQGQLQKFEQFLKIFIKTNSQINLSAIREPEDIILKHFVDSCILSLYRSDMFFLGSTCLDIGTGGGFPTIPLAILYPDVHFFALDTRKKKIGCIQDFCGKL